MAIDNVVDPATDYVPVCDICQGSVEDAGNPGGCNCPECETCGVSGDPACINTHMKWDKWPALKGQTPHAELERKRDREALAAEAAGYIKIDMVNPYCACEVQDWSNGNTHCYHCEKERKPS